MLMQMSRSLIAAVKHLIEVDERPFSTTNKILDAAVGPGDIDHTLGTRISCQLETVLQMLKAMCCHVQKDYSEELKRESAAIKKSADLNTAAANLKVGDYKGVITAASKVSHELQSWDTSPEPLTAERIKAFS